MLQLIYALTGDEGCPPLLEGQIDSFLRKLKQMLEDAIWLGRMRGRQGADDLFNAYNALSPQSQSSLLLSPESYDALNRLSNSTSEENFSALVAQCARLNEQERLSIESSPDLLHEPFTIEGVLNIDLGSDFCMRQDPTSPVFFGEFESYTLDEAHLISDKLARAYSEIGKASSTFSKLICLYGRRIFIRKNGTLSPASEQVDTELGGIRLRNVHLPEYEHDQLMDDLLHESVHNYLATFELLNYPFAIYGGRYPDNVRPVSPWSLRPIRILPFVHAAFVYFALLHLALRRLSKTNLDQTTRVIVQRQRNRYASGFLMPGTLSEKIGPDADVDLRALQMLDWMQATVVDMFGSRSVSESDPQLSNADEIMAPASSTV